MPGRPVGPVTAKKTPRSTERLRSMLAPRVMSESGADPFGSAPSSLDEYAMRDYQYNPAGFAPEELAQYRQMLARDQRGVFPSRTDIGGQELARYMTSDPSAIARQDSIYTAARLGDAESLQRRAMLNSLMRELGGIFGPRNVRLER